MATTCHQGHQRHHRCRNMLVRKQEYSAMLVSYFECDCNFFANFLQLTFSVQLLINPFSSGRPSTIFTSAAELHRWVEHNTCSCTAIQGNQNTRSDDSSCICQSYSCT
ncbi:unnamed protein product [Ixodes persulcatus]